MNPLSPPILYRRLPGHWYGVATKASAWLGPDHLLTVEQAWFVEHYVRLWFRDVESIVIQSTRSRELGLGLAAVILAAGLLLVLARRTSGPILVLIGAFVAAMGGITLLRELWQGKGCIVTVRTRTSSVRVRAWSRERAARRGIALLCDAIAAVQPSLTREWLSRTPTTDELESRPIGATPPSLPAGPPPRVWAGVVSGLLAIEGVIAAAAALGDRITPALGLLAITAIVILIGTAVTLVQSATPRAAELRQWALAVIVYWLVRGTILYALWVWESLQQARQSGDLPALVGMPNISGADTDMLWFFAALAAGSTLLAIFGGWAIRRVK